VFYSLVIGWLAWLATLRLTLWILVAVAVITYGVISLVISRRS
jgi:hypothetical protein